MRTILIAAILAASAPVAASAQVSEPTWLRMPRPEDFQAVWPAEATRRGLDGHAVIRCDVSIRGVLEGCKVLMEKPEGLGFGQAALLLSKQFVMKPRMVDGKPAIGVATIPINFETPNIGRAAGSDTILTDPAWLQTPTPKEMSDAYPKGALGTDATVHVVLRCQTTAKGELKGCEVLTTTPQRHGFGDAAKSLAGRFLLQLPAGAKPSRERAFVEVPFEFTDPSKPPTGPRMILHPRWVRTVDAGRMQRLYPAQAADAGVATGRGMVDCAIDAHGALNGCATIQEEPAGLGFGASAVAVASVMTLNPWTVEGEPAEGAHIRFPIRFNLNPDDPAPAAPPAK